MSAAALPAPTLVTPTALVDGGLPATAAGDEGLFALLLSMANGPAQARQPAPSQTGKLGDPASLIAPDQAKPGLLAPAALAPEALASASIASAALSSEALASEALAPKSLGRAALAPESLAGTALAIQALAKTAPQPTPSQSGSPIAEALLTPLAVELAPTADAADDTVVEPGEDKPEAGKPSATTPALSPDPAWLMAALIAPTLQVQGAPPTVKTSGQLTEQPARSTVPTPPLAGPASLAIPAPPDPSTPTPALQPASPSWAELTPAPALTPTAATSQTAVLAQAASAPSAPAETRIEPNARFRSRGPDRFAAPAPVRPGASATPTAAVVSPTVTALPASQTAPTSPTVGTDAVTAVLADPDEAGQSPSESGSTPTGFPGAGQAGEGSPAAAASAASTFAEPPRAVPATVHALAAEMVQKLGQRTSRFEVALNPIGLGRVDVSVQIGAQGQVSAALSFDRPGAAAELKGRAGELEAALRDAGFDVKPGALSFAALDSGELGSGGNGRDFARDSGSDPHGRSNANPAARAFGQADSLADMPPHPAVRALRGLDIQV